MMGTLKSFVRLIFLVFLFSLLPALIAGIWMGLMGLIGATGLILLLILFLLAGSERGMIRLFKAGLVVSRGLGRSLEFALVEAGENGFPSPRPLPPRLLVFPDPFPRAFGFRSLGGTGIILLSQGSIAALSEADLQIALQCCADQTRRVGVTVRTLCAFLALLILAITPHAWKNWVFWPRASISIGTVQKSQSVSSLSAIVFLLIFPLCQLLLRWGEINQTRSFAHQGAGRYRFGF
jgi:hypothetical protein